MSWPRLPPPPSSDEDSGPRRHLPGVLTLSSSPAPRPPLPLSWVGRGLGEQPSRAMLGLPGKAFPSTGWGKRGDGEASGLERVAGTQDSVGDRWRKDTACVQGKAAWSVVFDRCLRGSERSRGAVWGPGGREREGKEGAGEV